MAMSYLSMSSSSPAKQCTYGKFANVVSPAKAEPVLISIASWEKTCCGAMPAIGGNVISRAAHNAAKGMIKRIDMMSFEGNKEMRYNEVLNTNSCGYRKIMNWQLSCSMTMALRVEQESRRAVLPR